MAELAPIYDPDKKKPVTRPDLQALEGGGKTSPPNRDWYKDTPQPKDLSEKEDQAGEDNTKPDLKVIEGGKHPDQAGRGYSGEKAGSHSFRGRLKAHRKLLLGLGAGGAVTLMIIGGLFGILNVLKLDHLMSNVEQKAFLRNNSSLSKRSSKWISSYIEARMLDVGDSKNDNILFRSKRVDTNSPFTDWYKTLRASNFEQEVFEKHGIKFVSAVGPDGKPRLGKININGEKPIEVNISSADFAAIQNGDVGTLNKYRDSLDLEKFNNNKEARQAIKQVVNDNTHFLQVYKRRHLRKAIQNMTGVRDWRFFETSRDKLTDKKIDIRNKIVDKMVPDTHLLGKVTRCLFGVDKCKPSRDVGDPKNKANPTTLGPENIPTADQQKKDQAFRGQFKDQELKAADISGALKKTLDAANIYTRILNIPNTLDMLESVNSGMKNLVKFVVVARGAQAAGLFQVFETSRDQIKSGQVSAQEVNQFMQFMGPMASSEAYVKLISGQGDAGQLNTSAPATNYCSKESQARLEKDPTLAQKKPEFSFAYLCPDQQIGNPSRAQQLQDAYDSGIGGVVGPIATGWKGAKDSPLGPAITIVRWLGNSVSWLTNNVVSGVLEILGLKGDVEGAIKWMFAKLSNFLGVTILKGYESVGTIINWLIQGAAYSGEAAARQEGASITNDSSQTAAQLAIDQYQSDIRDRTTLYDHITSLDNPDSLVSKSMVALSDLKSDPGTTIMSGIHSVWSNMSKNFAAVLSGRTLAVTPNGYAAANLAGIETYDIPQRCYDLDPVTAGPLTDINGVLSTNVFDVLSANGVSASIADLGSTTNEQWATLASSDEFYKYVYSKLENKDNADDIAVQIYNCNLLDTAVRGSLGNLYGYTKDNGLEDGSSTTSTPTAPGTAGPAPTSLAGQPLKSNEQKWIQWIAQNVLPLLPNDTPDGRAGMAARVTWWSLREGVLNLDPPFGFSNCGDTGPNHVVDNLLYLCPTTDWQLGIGAVSLNNHTATDVEPETKKLHNTSDISQILGQVADLSGKSNDKSAVINSVDTKDSKLRASLLLRDPATGFFFEYTDVINECLGIPKLPIPEDFTPKNFCLGNSFSKDKPGIEQIINELTAYFQDSSGPASTPSGNAQELAKQILASPNIDLSTSNYCRYCMEDITNTSNGQPAYGNVNLNINLLKFLLALSQTSKVNVNSITGAGSGHSEDSNHYIGIAVDLSCSVDLAKADQIASQYGIKRYSGEACPQDGHWHYSTTGD